MKVYVSELPKSCSYCPCKCFETDTCQLNKGIKCPLDNKIANKCPLKSLSDYTKQVRKEVLADLKEKYKQKMANALGDDEEIGHINCDAVLEELLEEIGFDEVLELYRSQDKWYA